jgi:branched-chain amino acid aminotransferase
MNISIARAVRRPGRSVLDPNVKSLNYLNNIYALLETIEHGTLETLMLTWDGFVAEASADNLFSVAREPGWDTDPSRVLVRTPPGEFCLKGITRATVILSAREMGFRVDDRALLVPSDLTGKDRECFMTGTGAGCMPVVAVEGAPVGDGKPGPVTRALLDRIRKIMADPAWGIPLDATREDLGAYLSQPCKVVVG